MGEQALQLDRATVEWRLVDDEIVALDLRDSMYLGINASGAILWPMLVEGTTRTSLVAELEATYEIDTETASADVDAFVAMLRERQLLLDNPAAG